MIIGLLALLVASALAQAPAEAPAPEAAPAPEEPASTTTTTTTAAPATVPASATVSREAQCKNQMNACQVSRKFCAEDNENDGAVKLCQCTDKELACLRKIPITLECGSDAEFKERVYETDRGFGKPCMEAEATPTMGPWMGDGPTWGRTWDDTNEWEDTFGPPTTYYPPPAAYNCDTDEIQHCGEQVGKCASDAGGDLDSTCYCYSEYVECLGYMPECDSVKMAKVAICDAAQMAFGRDCCDVEDASPNRGGGVGAMVAAVVVISVLLAIALIWWGVRLNKTPPIDG